MSKRVQSKLYLPIKEPETKSNPNEYVFLEDSHGKPRVYVSMDMLNKYLKPTEYSKVLVYKLVQVNGVR